MIWDVLKKAKKALTIKEIRERFMEDYNKQTEVKSSNPEGRVNSIMAGLKRDGIAIPGPEAGTYILAPEKQ